MDQIEQLNGQLRAVKSILNSHPPKKEVFLISGAIGSGVTWTLHRCAESWREQGGSALMATGEQGAKGRSLFPWLTMMMPGTKQLARLEVLKEGLSQGSKAIPIVGSLASYVVQEVLDHKKRHLGRQAKLLTSQEQDILYVIERTSNDNRLMLVLDGIDAWDEASWSLLSLVLSGKLDDLYPSVRDALIVIGTAGQLSQKLDNLIKDILTQELTISLLGEEEMEVALRVFGFPSLDQDARTKLYKITNGRLDLLHDLSNHLRIYGFPTEYQDWKQLFSALLKLRVEELQIQIADLGDILGAATIVGETFGLDDLVCLTGADAASIVKSLNLASEKKLLTSEAGSSRFVSRELYRYFYETQIDRHRDYHRKFADCLRMMRPGDYEHRQQHLLLAEEFEKADICGVLAALAAVRNGRQESRDVFKRSSSAENELGKYLTAMLQAYEAFEKQQLSLGLEILEKIEGFLPDELSAERDYLEALLLLASPSVECYTRARELLSPLVAFEGVEGELWSRVLQNLIMAQAQTGKIDQALKLEKDLTAYYWRRRQTDPWAIYGLNMLRRRAECLHSLPTATERLESALAYFGSSDPGRTLPRHPSQYYKTLNNLIGNLLASGRFDEAGQRATELEDLIRRNPNIEWPSPHIAANNTILAYFLSSSLSVDEALTHFEQVVSTVTSDAGDHLLIQNNYAYFLICAERLTKAQLILEQALVTLGECELPDSYHRYFVCNNLAFLHLSLGDQSRAEELFKECSLDIDQFYPAIQATIRRRQELISEILPILIKPSIPELNGSLIEHFGMQIGPHWAFYGQSFLPTDIQYWTMD